MPAFGIAWTDLYTRPAMAARTPLHDRHLALGARMVEFGGYQMPLQYSSIREEHNAVRQRAGLFDLSHMGEVRLSGEESERTLERLIANDPRRLHPGLAQYAVMCNDRGGIVDDVVVYRDQDSFMVVVNAACRSKDLDWMRDHTGEATRVQDESEQTALIALQGPFAEEVLAPLTDLDLAALRPFRHSDADVVGVPTRISRTGYTGEDGFELFVASERAGALWDALLEAGTPQGVHPAGLGARDTLRLEAGLRLYGQDMDEDVDPYSCGLAWTVRRTNLDFIGAEALERLERENPPRRFIGLSLSGRSLARHGAEVRSGSRPIGVVTSGTFSFTLGHGIATAYISGDVSTPSDVLIDIRGSDVPARVTPLPFYRRRRREAT